MNRFIEKNGASDATRTRDPNLGKVVLYQLSYTRLLSNRFMLLCYFLKSKNNFIFMIIFLKSSHLYNINIIQAIMCFYF